MDSCHCGNSWRHLFCAGAVIVCFGRNRWQYHGEWTYGHLYRSIDIELDLPEKKAVSHSRAMGLVRSTIEIGVLVGSFFLSKWVMPYTVLAGLLARKAAALMVPWMEKIRLRKKKLL